jgi:hypothetical protein
MATTRPSLLRTPCPAVKTKFIAQFHIVFILFASPHALSYCAACELNARRARHLIPAATRNNSSALLSAAERYRGYNVFPAAPFVPAKIY